MPCLQLHLQNYTLTAKDPKQHGLKGFSVWDTTVWDPPVPRATNFRSENALTDGDPTVWEPTVPRATDFGSAPALTRAKRNYRGPHNASVV